jgi:hypothetical protein
MKSLAGTILGLVAGLYGCSDMGTAPLWEGWAEHSFAEYVTFSHPLPVSMTETAGPYYRSDVWGSAWSMSWNYAKRDSVFVFSGEWPGRPDIRTEIERGVILVGGRPADFVACRSLNYSTPPVEYYLWMQETGPRGWQLWISARCWSAGASDTVMAVFRSIRFIDAEGSLSPGTL